LQSTQKTFLSFFFNAACFVHGTKNFSLKSASNHAGFCGTDKSYPTMIAAAAAAAAAAARAAGIRSDHPEKQNPVIDLSTEATRIGTLRWTAPRTSSSSRPGVHSKNRSDHSLSRGIGSLEDN
jgi:hypothetical protein